MEYLDGIRLTFTKNSGDDEKTLEYGNFSNYNQHVYDYLTAQTLPTQGDETISGDVNTLTPFFAELFTIKITKKVAKVIFCNVEVGLSLNSKTQLRARTSNQAVVIPPYTPKTYLANHSLA